MTTTAQNIIESLLVRIFQYMPLTWVSKLGGWLGARHARKGILAQRLWVGRMHANLEKLWHMADPVQREQSIIAQKRHTGQVYAEIAVLPRLVQAGRLTVSGLEHIAGLSQPVIIVSAHLGNWELIGRVAELLERRVCDIYLPLGDGLRAKIAHQTRMAWRFEGGVGADLIPATPHALRQVSKSIANGSNVLLFIDEEKEGYVYAPSLGRTIPYAGNRWFAARLAVKHSMPILPVHIEPNGLGAYRAVIEPLLMPPSNGDADSRAKSLADEMDGQLERWVRKWPEHWYWLPLLDLDKPLARTSQPSHPEK